MAGEWGWRVTSNACGTLHPPPRTPHLSSMPLLSLRSVSLAFGGPPVLDRADLGIDRGERVCLLGRNGAGKSTLMKLLDRTIAPDDGEVVWQSGITVTRL